MDPFSMIVAIVALSTTGGLVSQFIKHRSQVAQLKLEAQQRSDAKVQASIEALRDEVKALRDTTMQYDLSFDAALQRMEHRVESVERRVNTVEQSQSINLRAGN